MAWDIRQLDPQWPFDLMGTSFTLDPAATALLVIDMQAGQSKLAEDSPLAQRYPDMARYFNQRGEAVVMSANLRLLEHFRARRMPVVFTRNGSLTPGGLERTARLRRRPATCYRGSAVYEIFEAFRPGENEPVIDKLTSSAFTASCLDHVLRNFGVRALVVTGVVTDMCVLGTARTGAELGYDVLICEDACAAYTQRCHDEALLTHARRFGRVAQADEIITELVSA